MYYDEHAKSVEYQDGQQVLVLLPIQGKPLNAKYQGPYTIIKRLAPVDYLLDTPGRRKSKRAFHVNFMKPYIIRTPTTTVNTVLIKQPEASPPFEQQVSVIVSHLDALPRSELASLLNNYVIVFSDKPGRYYDQLITITFRLSQARSLCLDPLTG